jgi:uracil-DNA glycosylase family 4
MKRLPLYENVNQPIQEIDGLDQDQSCSRCALHQYTPSGQRCLSAEGEPGGILVISDYPGEYERKLGRPMAGPAGRWLRELLERVAPGEKVAYTNALGCKPPEGWEAFEESVGACRPYVRKIIDEAQPRLILLMGPYAGLSVLGHTYQPLSVRKGYAWLGNIPVFLMPNPAAAVRNRLIARAFEEDLRWALTEAQPNGHSELQRHFEFHYHEIETVEDAEAAFTDLIASTSEQNPTSMDCETSGMQFEPDFRIECMAFSNGSSSYVFPRSAIENPEIAPILIALLEAGYFTSWNGLYDFCAIYNESFLRKYNHGKPVRMRLWSDARLKRKLYEADASGKLAIAADLVGMGGHKLEAHTLLKEICNELNKLALSRELTPKGKVRKRPELKYVQEAQVPEVWFEYLKSFDTEKFAYRFMDKKIMHRYCARDAHSTWHLEQWCERRMAELKDVDLGMVWREITQPAMWAYCEMTLNGIPLNKAKLTMFSQWLDVEMGKLKRELQVEVGDDDWNPKSDPQLRAEMEKRNLKTKRKTDGGKSGERKMKVDKESLEDFEDNPFIQKVARYRLLHHTQSNFAAGLIPYIRSDGRVHPTFLLDGTGTGRASSSEPNMFNQLKGRDEQSAELGKKLRACYEAPPGWVILEHDQGQIEVRMAAFLSGDKNLSDPLKDPNADFHMVNAKAFAKAQGKDPNTVTKMDRDDAKASVFASFYEIPCELPFLLSVRLDVDKSVGQSLADAMQKSFPDMMKWMYRCYEESWQRGYSITHWKGKPARRRPLWELAKNPPTLHELEEGLQNEKRNRRGAESPKSKYDTTSARATYNGDNQGSAVDVITSALWPVHCWLQSNTNGGQLFLTIYDSIMTMVRQEDAQKTHEAVVRIMTDPSRLPGIPMVVDGKWGPTWATLEKIK